MFVIWCLCIRHAASQAAPRQGSIGASEGVRRYPAALRQNETARGAISSACPAPKTTPQVLSAWPTVTRGWLEVSDGCCHTGETPKTQVFRLLQEEEDSWCKSSWLSIVNRWVRGALSNAYDLFSIVQKLMSKFNCKFILKKIFWVEVIFPFRNILKFWFQFFYNYIVTAMRSSYWLSETLDDQAMCRFCSSSSQ